MNRKETLYVFLGVGKPIIIDTEVKDIDSWLAYVKNADATDIIILNDKLFVPRNNINAILFSRDKIEESKVNLKILFVFSGDSITLSSHIEQADIVHIRTILCRLWEIEGSIMKTETDSLLILNKRLMGVYIQKAPQLSLNSCESQKPDITSSEVEQIV
jgi:hypothetical protein